MRFQTSGNIAQTRGGVGNRRLYGIPYYTDPQLVRVQTPFKHGLRSQRIKRLIAKSSRAILLV
jgi:hypothetical protein